MYPILGPYLKHIGKSGPTITYVALTILGSAALAQNIRFEVASVKPMTPGARGMHYTGGPGTADPSTVTCENCSLSLLVMIAYNVRGYQLKAPTWMDDNRYSVVAKVPVSTNQSQFLQMLQGLLSERFRLVTHTEKVRTDIYELTIAKGGAKLSESKEPVEEKPESLWTPPAFGPPRRTKAQITRKGASVAELALFLSDSLAQPVKDSTGLKGRYDYSFSFIMDPGGRAAGPTTSSSESEAGASLIDAVRETLGLNLIRTKGENAVLVVDSAQKIPTDN